MARTVAQIQAQIITNWQADPNLSAANSTSQTAKWKLFTFIMAVAIAFFEQLQDVFRTEMEQIADSAISGNAIWVQSQVFKFQYSSTIAQVVEILNFVPTYAVIDSTLQIITRCSVVTNSNNAVDIKVAKSDPPISLSGGEAIALEGYLSEIMFAGIQYTLINADSDKMEVVANVYFNGQYSVVIQTNVKLALTNYMSTLPFNGVAKATDIEATIRSVTGVVDVEMTTIKTRRDTTSYSSSFVMYDLATGINQRQWSTYAGYIVEETTSGHTFSDTLTFIPQN